MDLLLGLPAHPFLVHGAVVLLPLAAIGVIIIAVSPRLRTKYSGLVVVFAAMSSGALALASGSGEALARRVEFNEATTQHVQIGESGVAAGVAVLIAALVLWWMQWSRGGQKPTGWLSMLVVVVAILVAIGATVQVGRIGHSGAKSVWAKAAEATPNNWSEDEGE